MKSLENFGEKAPSFGVKKIWFLQTNDIKKEVNTLQQDNRKDMMGASQELIQSYPPQAQG